MKLCSLIERLVEIKNIISIVSSSEIPGWTQEAYISTYFIASNARITNGPLSRGGGVTLAGLAV